MLVTVYDWYTRFKEGREDVNDDERSGRSREAVNEEKIKIVNDFIKNEPKSSLRYMGMELNISTSSIYHILTEHLGQNIVKVEVGDCYTIMRHFIVQS